MQRNGINGAVTHRQKRCGNTQKTQDISRATGHATTHTNICHHLSKLSDIRSAVRSRQVSVTSVRPAKKQIKRTTRVNMREHTHGPNKKRLRGLETKHIGIMVVIGAIIQQPRQSTCQGHGHDQNRRCNCVNQPCQRRESECNHQGRRTSGCPESGSAFIMKRVCVSGSLCCVVQATSS